MVAFVETTSRPPRWIKPQLTRLAEEAPQGTDWLHEIKYDGYRMHARIDGAKIQLLTRTGLDWSHRYKCTIEALRSLKVKSAYLDGELCALNGDGLPVFSRLQAAMDEGRTDQLLFFAFFCFSMGRARHNCRSSCARSGSSGYSRRISEGCGTTSM
jgi:ATP-dependent DNA ligase